MIRGEFKKKLGVGVARWRLSFFLFRSIFAIFFSLAVILFQADVLAEAKGFSDLDVDDKYYQQIIYLQEIGAVHGYPDGTFQAERPVNRAEVLKMVFLSLKPFYFSMSALTGEIELIATVAATADGTRKYPDVHPDAWFFPYVSQATIDGIVSGMPDGNYEPDRNVNLAELLKIVFRNDNRDIEVYVKTAPYADVPRLAWYTRYFEYARFLALLVPDEAGKVYPDKKLTRGEVADILYKYLREKEKKRPGVATYYGADFQGKGTASGEKFDMNAMTAAHKVLPFNTMVRVTNKENGKSVLVRINDRGPFVVGKDFDLSKGAFESITLLGRGIINIEWQIVSDYDAAHDI